MDLAAVLQEQGLSEYIPVLRANGLDHPRDLALVSEADLEAIGVSKLFHCRRLLDVGRRFADPRGASSSAERSPSLPSCSPSSATVSPGPQRLPLATEPTPTAYRPGHTLQTSTGLPLPPAPGPQRPVSTPPAPEPGKGDHIAVQVLAARGARPQDAPNNTATTVVLSEREHYLKLSLCDSVDGDIFPIADTTKRTPKVRGPVLLWHPPAELRVPTTFKQHCLALELKEDRFFGDNKLVGVCVLPLSYFHSFTADTVVDSWFPVRQDCDRDSPVTATVQLRLWVPGGCPRELGAAYHVTSVLMKQRALRVVIFDAALSKYAEAERQAAVEDMERALSRSDGFDGVAPGPPPRRGHSRTASNTSQGSEAGLAQGLPSTYVTVQLEGAGGEPVLPDGAPAGGSPASSTDVVGDEAGGCFGFGRRGASSGYRSPALLPADGSAPAPDCGVRSSLEAKRRTRVVHKTARPDYSESFEFREEAGRAKILHVKLKRVGVFANDVVGAVKIPIQFFMAQKDADDVDELFAARDDKGREVARIHIRLQITHTAVAPAGGTGRSAGLAAPSLRPTEWGGATVAPGGPAALSSTFSTQQRSGSVPQQQELSAPDLDASAWSPAERHADPEAPTPRGILKSSTPPAMPHREGSQHTPAPAPLHDIPVFDPESRVFHRTASGGIQRPVVDPDDHPVFSPKRPPPPAAAPQPALSMEALADGDDSAPALSRQSTQPPVSPPRDGAAKAQPKPVGPFAPVGDLRHGSSKPLTLAFSRGVSANPASPPAGGRLFSYHHDIQKSPHASADSAAGTEVDPPSDPPPVATESVDSTLQGAQHLRVLPTADVPDSRYGGLQTYSATTDDAEVAATPSDGERPAVGAASTDEWLFPKRSGDNLL